MEERCAAYCLGYAGCVGFETNRNHKKNEGIVKEVCFALLEDFNYPYMEYWKDDDTKEYWNVQTIAMLQSYYKNLQTPTVKPPDGVINGEIKINGICKEVVNRMGKVNYREFDKTEFYALEQRNVFQASSGPWAKYNCPRSCFESAGCSAFFVEGDACHWVMSAPSSKADNSAVNLAGMLHSGLCPNTAFTNTFTKRSEVYCLLQTQNEAEDLIQSLLQANTGSPYSIRLIVIRLIRY